MGHFVKIILCWILKLGHILVAQTGCKQAAEDFWPADELIIDPPISFIWQILFYIPISLAGALFGWIGLVASVVFFIQQHNLGNFIIQILICSMLAILLSAYVIRQFIFLNNLWILRRRGEKAAGLVTNNKTHRGGTPASPVISYLIDVRMLVITHSGEKEYYVLAGKGYSDFAASLCKDDGLVIFYDPKFPRRARISSEI